MALWGKKREDRDEQRTVTEYYKLHSNAVDDLIHANEDNSPEVSEEELRKYLSGPKLRMADWVKAILVKMWFAGSVCFFIFWGLSAFVSARLDLLLVFGVALGIVTDLLTSNVLRFIAKTPAENDRWMMFPRKKYYTFFGNIIYALVLLACVDVLYNLINMGIAAVVGGPGVVTLGVEPILFGVFYTGFDLLFLTMKHTIIQVFTDALASVRVRQKS